MSNMLKTPKFIHHIIYGKKYSMISDSEVIQELSINPKYFKWLQNKGSMDFQYMHEYFSRVFPLLSCTPILRAFKKDAAIVNFIQFWMPAALRINQKVEENKKTNEPFFSLVHGCQGSGKTTFSQILEQILKIEGHKGVQVSVDDFYLRFSERENLKKDHPFLRFRGPPGTHDLKLMKETFENLRTGRDTEIPKFDKGLFNGGGDRVAGEKVTEKQDFVIFEGYLNGFRACSEKEMDKITGKMAKIEDIWLAEFSNEELKKYEKVWDLFDETTAIIPKDYGYSFIWREEAEKVKKPLK